MTNVNKYLDRNGNTRYQFQLYMGIDPQTGNKKRTRRRGFRTKKEATLALSRLTLELESKSSLPTENNILFSEVYSEWYEQYINTVQVLGIELQECLITIFYQSLVINAYERLR